MILDKRQKELVKKALDDYDFIKEEITNKIAKGYDIDDLSIFLTRFKDIEISNIEKYDDYEYLDFLYKDLNMCVMFDTDKGLRVSNTFEIYDKKTCEYIVEDFLTKDEYTKLINKTREEELEDMIATLKYYDSHNLEADYKIYTNKIISFLKENW